MEEKSQESLPLSMQSKIAFGFATVAEKCKEQSLSLDDHLVKKPASTYFLRAKGDSMQETIKPNDLLVVDRSLTPGQGHVILAQWQGELICKRFFQFPQHIELRSDNPKYPLIKIIQNDFEDFAIWGVVCHVIHSLC